MISIADCRSILKKNGYEGIDDMPDERIRELRDFLYQLAELQIENEKAMAQQAIAKKTKKNK